MWGVVGNRYYALNSILNKMVGFVAIVHNLNDKRFVLNMCDIFFPFHIFLKRNAIKIGTRSKSAHNKMRSNPIQMEIIVFGFWSSSHIYNSIEPHQSYHFSCSTLTFMVYFIYSATGNPLRCLFIVVNAIVVDISSSLSLFVNARVVLSIFSKDMIDNHIHTERQEMHAKP